MKSDIRMGMHNNCIKGPAHLCVRSCTRLVVVGLFYYSVFGKQLFY